MGIEHTVKRKKQVIKQPAVTHRWKNRSAASGPVPTCLALLALALSLRKVVDFYENPRNAGSFVKTYQSH